MDETTSIDGAGTLTNAPDGGYRVRFVRAYDRPVEDLWAALTEPELLDSWYPTKLRTDGVVGNPVTETFESTDGTPPEPTPPGTLTAYEPPHVFEYRVHGPAEAEYPGMIGEQRIRMEAGPGGHDGESVLTFTHDIEKLEGAAGDKVTFDEVLFLGGDSPQFGSPLVSGAKVSGEIVTQGRGEKLVIFKFKKRKKYRRKAGHRQAFTAVKITEVQG